MTLATVPYYLREPLTGHAVSQDYRSEREAWAAMGHSELLEVRVDSGKLHGMAFGFDSGQRPKMGERRVDPAWAMYVRSRLVEQLREYYASAG